MNSSVIEDERQFPGNKYINDTYFINGSDPCHPPINIKVYVVVNRLVYMRNNSSSKISY